MVIQLTIKNSFSHAYYVSGHQFAWFVLYNETVNCIDHINRIKTDNRPANLNVTTSQNSMNMKVYKGIYLP
jgi:hypothetical protein